MKKSDARWLLFPQIPCIFSEDQKKDDAGDRRSLGARARSRAWFPASPQLR
jgi:hypothetical protein